MQLCKIPNEQFENNFFYSNTRQTTITKEYWLFKGYNKEKKFE